MKFVFVKAFGAMSLLIGSPSRRHAQSTKMVLFPKWLQGHHASGADADDGRGADIAMGALRMNA